jgi:hypothetical protein
MENPTVVVLTDRNDLDDQLFSTFARCKALLRQPPVQAESRAHLRELLSVQIAQLGRPQAVAIADQDHGRVPMAVAAGLPGGRHQALDLGRRQVLAGAN